MLSLIANPAICQAEDALLPVTFAKLEAFKERVWQAREKGELTPERVKELSSELPKAETAHYVSLKHRAGALLLGLTVLLGSEPYWFNQSKLAGWCVST